MASVFEERCRLEIDVEAHEDPDKNDSEPRHSEQPANDRFSVKEKKSDADDEWEQREAK